MTPADIWTKAIDMTLAALRDGSADRGESLRDLADSFDRERDGELVAAELRRAREAAGGVAPRYRVVSVQEYASLVLAGVAVHQWNVLPGETLASSLAKWSKQASDGRGGWLVVGPSGKHRGLLDVIGEDGGEPEDQLLVRDLKWVAPALCAAFDEGLAEGFGGSR